jgi:hypothetical protein
MADPVDSLEVRWITPGPVTPAMREWFARSEPGLLRPALEHAIGPIFAVGPPPGSGFIFSPGNSQSYGQWLYQMRDAGRQSRCAAGTTMRGSSLS